MSWLLHNLHLFVTQTFSSHFTEGRCWPTSAGRPTSFRLPLSASVHSVPGPPYLRPGLGRAPFIRPCSPRPSCSQVPSLCPAHLLVCQSPGSSANLEGKASILATLRAMLRTVCSVNVCSVNLCLLHCGSRRHVSRWAGTFWLVLAADGGLVWISCHGSFRRCIRTRKTARKRACLTFDCLYARDTPTLGSETRRGGGDPAPNTCDSCGMETGTSATRTR